MCQIFTMEDKIKRSIATNFRSSFFIINFHVLNKKIFGLLISQAVNGEVYFVLVSVLFCHIGNHAFTSTIQHRFGNSIDQSEHA